MGTVRMKVERADPSGKVVFEAERVSKAYAGTAVVRDFSTRILRGDRVGIIGPNGAGKTTLLRLLLGDLPPDEGEVRRGANVEVAYYDQQREQLDPERTVVDVIGDGNDTITVNGQTRHVNGYLADFLFPPERARSPVRALSGGERNRLLLARLFTRPANVLVLDEPTNDLDLETLELLESQLAEWPGTLLLVSHDRAFLDDVVTSTLVFEGNAKVQEYVGGYADWLRQRRAQAVEAPAQDAKAPKPSAAEPGSAATSASQTRKRLSFKEQRELEQLPTQIASLEREQSALRERVASPLFYREPADAIKDALARLAAVEIELTQAYSRWDELDSRSS